MNKLFSSFTYKLTLFTFIIAFVSIFIGGKAFSETVYTSAQLEETLSGGTISDSVLFETTNATGTTWMLQGDLTITGDLTISKNCTLSFGSYDLTVSGDSSVSGNIVIGAGGGLFIGSESNFIFYDTSGITVSGNSFSRGFITSSNSGYSYLTLDGVLSLNYVNITNLSASGFNLTGNADINGFNNVAFNNFGGFFLSSFIRVDVNVLTNSGVLTSSGCSFDNSNGYTAYNVEVIAPGGASVDYWHFSSATGVLSGESNDNDTYNLIHWDGETKYSGGSGDGYNMANLNDASFSDTTYISSEEDQIFFVGDGAKEILPILISCNSYMTAPDDIRIKIPASFNMLWDTADTTADISLTSVPGGGAVSSTVSYEDSGKTLVLDVTADLMDGDILTVSGLSFVSFSNSNDTDRLEMELGNDGVSNYEDLKTIRILTVSDTKYGGGKGDGYNMANEDNVASYDYGDSIYYIWRGGGADNNWSTVANWENGDKYPNLSSNDVVFNDTTNDDCVADTSVTVGDMFLHSSYIGDLTLSTNITIDGSLSVSGNSVIFTNSNVLKITGSLTLSGTSIKS